MAACEQTHGMNMLQHGQAVHDAYLHLHKELSQGSMTQEEPALQAWFDKMRASNPCDIMSPQELRAYHLYHDCGKHLVLCTDENGKRHFPEHAKASAVQYNRIFPNDHITRNLIERDMDFHTMRGDDLRALWSQPLAATLYLTAWAEVRANAAMFGGLQSESYKIKRSRLVQAAKKCSFLPARVFSTFNF